ncbi:MAG: hypothetical protein U9O97_05565 [Elusimicrobiota bacterium]|nr:hypothetical protein [Elusimicrobiota bacterium]
MKLIKSLFAVAVLWSAAGNAIGGGFSKLEMVKETLNRANFRVTWKYPEPLTELEKYRAAIRNKKINSFSNLLDEILSRAGAERINVMIMPGVKNSFDSQRKTVFLEAGDGFDIKKSLDVIISSLGIKADYSGIRDYFGRPVPMNGAFLAFFQMNGKFYLASEKNGKSSLLLEEEDYFNSINTAGKNFAAYRLRNSLWFVDIKKKKNFRYYTTDDSPEKGWSGELFLKTFDSDGQSCAVVVMSGGKSNILHGKLSGAPKILFADLPYSIDEIYVTGNKIIFSASAGKGRAIIGVASAGQKKIFNIYSINGEFIVMGKYSGGILVFYPGSKEIAFLDERHQTVLIRDLKVKKIRGDEGVKYLIAPDGENAGDDVKKALLKSFSPRAVYLRDENHLNFLYKKLSSSDHCSFYPLSGDECVLLEKDRYTRKFKKYAVRGLLSEERLLFENEKHRRKYALAVSALFVTLILIAQGVINVKKKQKSG